MSDDNVVPFDNSSMPFDEFGDVVGRVRSSKRRKMRPAQRSAPEADWDNLFGIDYSIHDFITEAVNNEGQTRSIYVSTPPEMKSIAHVIVDSGKYPAYRSIHDVFRDGFYHRVHYLLSTWADPPPQVQEWIDRVRDINRAARIRRNQELDEQLVEQYQEGLDKFERRGDRVRHREMLENARESLGTLDEPYRSELKAVVDRHERLAR